MKVRDLVASLDHVVVAGSSKINPEVDRQLVSETGYGLLLHAVDQGAIELVSTLLEYGADPFVIGGPYGESALHIASGRALTELCEVLLRCGLRVDARTTQGKTPLHYAASVVRGSYTTSLLLVTNGAEIEARDENDSTALVDAAKSSNVAIVDLLLDCGAKADVVDAYGWTPMIAAQEQIVTIPRRRNGSIISAFRDQAREARDVLHLLGQHSRSVHEADESGAPEKPLTITGSEESQQVVKAAQWAIIRRNALRLRSLIRSSPWLSYTNGDSLMRLAIESGHADSVDALVDAGVSVRSVDLEGDTPLHGEASITGCHAVCKRLIACGAK